MGNRITCCRQRWFQLSNENLSEDSPETVEKDIREKLCYFNSAAVFNTELALNRVTESQSTTFTVHNTAVADKPLNTNRFSTQHISEREPDDFEYDPSFNASRHSLFIMGMNDSNYYPSSPHILNRAYSSGHPSWHRLPGSLQSAQLRRWSSCYTAYIGDSWFAYPNQESILRSISLAIELLFDSALNRANCSATADRKTASSDTPLHRDMGDLYDERQFPLGIPSPTVSDECTSHFNVVSTQPPKAHTIHEFIQALFRATFLGPQAAIVALIFLERLVNAAEVGLRPWTWRRQFLACLLLASKVLDDQAVWNTDYRRVLKDVRVEDLNALERHTLSLLQFNINVPLAVYARYYFDLLSTGQTLNLINRISDRRLLTSEVASQLQILPLSEGSSNCAHSDSHLRSLFGFNLIAGQSQSSGNRRHLRVTRRTQRSSRKVTPHISERTMRPSRPASCHSRLNTCTSSDNLLVHSKRHLTSDTDEGPLLLDDETDFINNLSAPVLSPPKVNLPTRSIEVQQHPPAFIQSLYSSPHTVSRYDSGGGSSYKRLRNHPPKSSAISQTGQLDGFGFMRSVMGGDVAYSLLREAGVCID